MKVNFTPQVKSALKILFCASVSMIIKIIDNDKKQKELNDQFTIVIDKIKLLMNCEKEPEIILNKYIAILKTSRNIFKGNEYTILNRINGILNSGNESKIMLENLNFFMISLETVCSNETDIPIVESCEN